MTIRTKLLGVTVTLCALFSLGMYLTVRHLVDDIVHELLWKYSEVTAKHDSQNILTELNHQVDMAKVVANDQRVVQWARAPSDKQRKQQALDWLENQSHLFSEDNLFIALDKNLSYYVINGADPKTQSPFRYHFNPNKADEDWYFRYTRKHLVKPDATVDYDETLGLVKLWMTVPIIQNGKFLGLTGTGFELGSLVPKLLGEKVDGINTVYVNQKGEIELDHSFLSGNFVHDLDKLRHKKTLHQVVNSDASYKVIKDLMELQSQGKESDTLVVSLEPNGMFASIKFIQGLGWYQVKFVDIDEVLDGNYLESFAEISLVMFMVFTLLMFTFVNRKVFDPLIAVHRHLKRMMPEGKRSRSKDFFKDITHNLEELDRELFRSRHSLDSLVRERTETLDQLAMIDPLTGLLNRSGMEREINSELARTKREGSAFGLVWISIEGMEESDIVDITAHLERDKKLQYASALLQKVVREYDCACRWADGEFVVLIRSHQAQALEALTERFKTEIADDPNGVEILFALGGLVVDPAMSLQDALAKADSALYMAKSKPQDKVYIIHSSTSERYRG